MKRSLLILMVAFLTTSVFAQSENWNWQQRIVDTDGNIVKNEILEVTATVHDLSQEYYREIQVDSINANGILFITLERGSVPWGEKAFYLDLEFDSKKYEIKNIKNLPIDNVPEAFYAKTAGVAKNVKPEYINKIYILDSLTGPEVRIFLNRLVEEDFTRLGNYFTSTTYLYDATKLIHAASSNSLYPIGDTLTLEFINYVEISKVEKEVETKNGPRIEVTTIYSSDIVTKTYHEVVLTESGSYFAPSDPVTGEPILTDITKKEVTKFFKSVIVYKEVK